MTAPTRRRLLAFGLGGLALPRPFIAGRTAMADTVPDTVVYVSNAASKEIYALAMNRETGELSMLDRVPVPGTDKPSPASMPMAVSPDRRFLYAALRSDTFPASTFAIDRASGRLTHLATTLLQDSMAYIITDRTGRYLLAASYPGNKLTTNPIDDQGHILEKTTQIIPDRPKSHCILVDAANKYCYATSLGSDIVMEWKFDPATGRLSPNGPGEVHTKPGAGPRHMALHPNGRFLYLITETTDTVGAYAIDPASGTLTELQFVDARPAGFTDQPAAADLHVTPDGRFLYGSERKTSTLAGYRIDPDKGTLSPIGHFPTERRRGGSTSTRAAAFCSPSASIRTR
jgi:6-phosphogluconolactonase